MQAEPESTITRRPLHSQVADRLRELIIQGDLPPGDRLNERLLCEKFGISRTPLREAIKLLSLEGFVRLFPNRGAEVTEITLDQTEDMFQLMAALESLAGELACHHASNDDIERIRALQMAMAEAFERGDRNQYFRINQQIHEAIIECARNAELKTVYLQLSRRIQRARYMANLSSDRWVHAMHEHEDILRALEDRDAERLKRILGMHLNNKFKAIQSWLGQQHRGRDTAVGKT